MTNQCTEWDLIELERYREEERQRIDDEIEQRRQRERERKEQAEYELRTASSWPDALRQQSFLMRRETDIDVNEFGIEPDHFFQESADACDRALEIWQEVAAGKQAQIDELQRQIEAIQDNICTEVANKLEAEGEGISKWWKHVASAIREDDYNNWLWW